MSKKIRYTLLLSGFVFFLMLAPVIVLYVRGITYDFATKRFVQTGILALNVSPKNSEIYLNGSPKHAGSGDIKFLLPGEYQVTIKKDGYSDWSKHLAISAGEVSWASPADNSIYLFYSAPKITPVAGNVTDFYSGNGRLIYLTADQNLAVSNGTDFNRNSLYPLPKPADKILADDGNKNFLLTDSAESSNPTLLLFSADNGRFTDLTGLFAALPQFQFSSDGTLYALDNGTLYRVNVGAQTKQEVLQNVQTFYFQNNDLYYIADTAATSSLELSQPPFAQSQVLLANLPEFSGSRLFVTFGKQIFLLADGSLYQANSTLQKIADNVSRYNFDPTSSNLEIIDAGEFDYYDSAGQNLNFVTRSNAALSNPVLRDNIGYGFYLDDKGVSAIELDTRDRQNSYLLYPGRDVTKFVVDAPAQKILVLDGGSLKSLVIR